MKAYEHENGMSESNGKVGNNEIIKYFFQAVRKLKDLIL